MRQTESILAFCIKEESNQASDATIHGMEDGERECGQLTYSINPSISLLWISLVCHIVYMMKEWRCFVSQGNKMQIAELKWGGPRVSSWSVWKLSIIEIMGSFFIPLSPPRWPCSGICFSSFPLSSGFSHPLTNILNIIHFPPPATIPDFTPFLQHKSEDLSILKTSTSLLSIFLIQSDFWIYHNNFY